MVDPRNKDPIKTLLRLAPWTEQVKEITYLSGGYSNDNYYVSTNEKNYALRIRKRPRPSKNEQQYLKISNAPEVAAYDSMTCLLYTSPSPRDLSTSRMPSSA